MKLFLTSSGLSDKNEQMFLELLEQDPKGLRVAFIPTAMNQESEELKQTYIPVDVADLEHLGMKVEFIDLVNIKEENIVSALDSFDIIYVYGGNTFYLMHHIVLSGFKKHFKEIMKDKIYFGVSAGSIIAGPDVSIAGLKGGDTNDIGLVDMEGLSVVPFSLLPHWNGEIPSNLKDYKYEIRYIKDEEAVSVFK